MSHHELQVIVGLLTLGGFVFAVGMVSVLAEKKGEKVTPTREQIAARISCVLMETWFSLGKQQRVYPSGTAYKIADAILREYEIRERDELPKL